MARASRKGSATLITYDKEVMVVSRHRISIGPDGLHHALLDDERTRRERKVAWVRGIVYDDAGRIVREFAYGYDGRGRLRGGQALDANHPPPKTIAAVQKLLRSRPLRHQGASHELRREIVAVTLDVVKKRKCAISTVAAEIGMPGPTLTRWVAQQRAFVTAGARSRPGRTDARRGRRAKEETDRTGRGSAARRGTGRRRTGS